MVGGCCVGGVVSKCTAGVEERRSAGKGCESAEQDC